MRRLILPALAILMATFACVAPGGATEASAAVSQKATLVSPRVPDFINTKPVYPRISFPGCPRKDGFNGNVQWTDLASIQIWGEIWDSCGTQVSVFLTFYAPGYHNPAVGTAAFGSTNGVNQLFDTMIGNPGHISVTVCGWWVGKWMCGAPYSI